MNRFKGDGNYYESHHILPSSLGGSNDKSNRVLLTGREHFVAHRLLSKMLPDSKHLHNMNFAVWMMTLKTDQHIREIKVSSRLYEVLKKNAAEASSFVMKNHIKTAEHRSNMSKSLKGRKLSVETREKISKAGIGRKHSKNTRDKMRESHLGKTFSDEHRLNLGLARTGFKHSETTRGKMSDSQRKRLKSPEERAKHSSRKGCKNSKEQNANISKSNCKPCTVDGIKIYPSKGALIEELGSGKNGSRSSTFRFINQEEGQ
jgi:hypothetical protein